MPTACCCWWRSLAWWLSNTRSRWRVPVSALVTCRCIAATARLLSSGSDGPPRATGTTDARAGRPTLAFSFTGLLIGSIVYSLPLPSMPIVSRVRCYRPPTERWLHLAGRPIDAFFRCVAAGAPGAHSHDPVLRPTRLNSGRLMIGGNIPGQTRVVSTLIYGHGSRRWNTTSAPVGRGHGGFRVVLCSACH